MITKIYVCTHKKFTPPNDDLYVPLHVGKAISDDLGYKGDDKGDSISHKNKSFCELTGLYWIWKNSNADIVGLCHYRRYLIKNESFLTKNYIESLLTQQGYDIIVPASGWSPYKTNKDHYYSTHFAKDYKCMKQVLTEKYPDYVPAFDRFSHTNLASLANIIITRKEILNEYCNWLFDILFEVETRTDLSGYDSFQVRLFGYLSERLLRVWLFMHNYKIKEEEVRLIDPACADNAEKTINLKYKYSELFFKNFIDEYRVNISHYAKSYENLSTDLSDKIPVFICWWQGLHNMPPLINMCINSIYKNIPQDIAEVHLITFENVNQYVNFPQYIIDKFNSGLITMTHLSDILRMNLLSKYGGMWIDATYYFSAPLDCKIFMDYEIFTLKFSHTIWKADIVQGRWSGNFLYCQKPNILTHFCLNALYEYWKHQDSLIDYFLIDYIIALCYDNFPEIKNSFDKCPFQSLSVFKLQQMLSHPFDMSLYNKLTFDTHIFKLSWKNNYSTEDLLRHQTFYGYLLSHENL